MAPLCDHGDDRCAAKRGRAGGYRPAVRDDDLAREAQANAVAVGARGVKRQEHILAAIRVDPRSIVEDLDTNPVLRERLQGNPDVRCGGRSARSRRGIR